MSARNFVNNAPALALTAGVSDVDTNLPTGSTTGYPSTPFTIVLERNVPGNKEVVLVTTVNPTSFDVTRGYDGTAGVAHLIGASVEHAVAALDYAEASEHINNTGLDHHTQYLNTTRHDSTDHSGVAGIAGLIVPTGSVIPYSGAADPTGWFVCDGRAISRATYSVLFALVAETYGVGDGATTFNIPDLRGRMALGNDDGGTLGSAGRIVAASGNILAGSAGVEEHLLTAAQMPAHAHGGGAHTHTGTTGSAGAHQHGTGAVGFLAAVVAGGTAGTTAGASVAILPLTVSAGSHTHPFTTASQTITTNSQGGGLPHNNMPPYLTLNYIIKAV